VTPVAVGIAVVGAGPAGLAAAGDARTAGTRVLLIEERPALGGRAMIVPGARGLAEGLMRDLGGVEVWRNSPVWALCGRTLFVLRGDRVETVAADAVILATGARETLLPFPGWTLGGVTTVEGGWEAVRAGRVGPEAGPAVVVGGLFAATLANRLHERGLVVSVIAPDRPRGLAEAVAHVTAPLTAAHGTDVVEEVSLADGARHPCAMLCVESPRSPATELARQAGCPSLYHPLLGGFVPRYDPFMMLHGPTARVFIAGDASGLDNPRAAAESGRLASRAALRVLALLPDAEERIAEVRQRLRDASVPLHARAREALMTGAVPDEVVERWDGLPETVVCPCEAVTAGDLRDALEDGARTPDDIVRLTGCGTGVCRGRRCEGAMMRWLSGVLETPIGRMSQPQVRPPVRPVPVAAVVQAASADHA